MLSFMCLPLSWWCPEKDNAALSYMLHTMLFSTPSPILTGKFIMSLEKKKTFAENVFSESTPRCFYKKSKASVFLPAFSFSATGQLPDQRTHHKDATAFCFVWPTTSFEQPSFFWQTRTCERKPFCVSFCWNCVFVYSVVWVLFLLVFVEMSFCFRCTPLFTCTVWKISASLPSCYYLQLIFFLRAIIYFSSCRSCQILQLSHQLQARILLFSYTGFRFNICSFSYLNQLCITLAKPFFIFRSLNLPLYPAL